MKKSLLFILICFFNLVTDLSAQSYLAKMDGTPVSDIYYSISKIGENSGYGYAKQERGTSYALIDSLGNRATPFEYDRVAYLDECDIFALSKGRKYGFYDKNMNEIVSHKYDGYGIIENNREMLYITITELNEQDKKVQEKWGIIALKTGKEVVPCIYDNIGYGKGDFFTVKKDGKWGVLFQNKLIIPFEYEYLNLSTKEVLDEGYSFVQMEKYGDWGVIDSTGQFVTPISFDDYGFETHRNHDSIKSRLGYVSKDRNVAIINRKGQVLTPYIYYRGFSQSTFRCQGEPGGIVAARGEFPNYEHYYIDSTGVEAAKLDEKLFYRYYRTTESDTITVVALQTDSGVVYRFPALEALQNLQPPQEKEIVYHFEQDDEANIVRKESGIGLDSLGHVIIPAIYEEIQRVSDNYYKVRENGKFALADQRGHFITPFDYEDIWRFTDNLFQIEKKVESGVYNGLINKQGELVLFGEMVIEVLDNEQIILARSDRYTLVNQKTGKSFERADHIVRFKNDKMLLLQNNKWGMVDLVTEKMIIPVKYKTLEITNDYHIMGQKDIGKNADVDACIGCPPPDYKWGVLDLQGNEIIPFEYEEIIPYYGNLLILRKK